MAEPGRLAELAGRLLPRLDAAMPTDILPVLEDFLVEHAGVEEVGLLLIDYDLHVLQRLQPGDITTPVESLPVDASDPGHAYSSQAAVSVPSGSRTIVYVPLTVRAERLGVLEVRLGGSVDAGLLAGLAQVASTVAYVVLAAGRYTDQYERARRRTDLALAAEMQWNLLPVRAFSCPQFELAGQLMPAYEVGGDCFDYSVEAGVLNVSITDAMGHALRASLLAALAVTALRNARRANRSLSAQIETADAAVYSQFGGAQFVTALALQIDMQTGVARAVNAGHPPIHRVREGRIEVVEIEPQLPLGLFERTRYAQHELALQPGDRLLLLSDGIFEAGPPGVEEFGESRLEGALLATATLPCHEAVRQVLRAVSDYQQGTFRDDATVLCLDWHGQ